MWMTKVSIKNPVFASMVMLALLVLGFVSYRLLPVERMPNIASPLAFVQVVYPGASPEAIENDVIKPLEDQINTVNGIKHIWATSREGVGMMKIEFRLDVDSSLAIQEIRDKVALVRPSFPKEVKDPLVLKADITENSQPVVQLALRSDTRSLRELTSMADQVIAKQLRMVGGVGSVRVNGSVARQIQIFMHPDRMRALEVGVDQVISAIQDANQDVPAGAVIGNVKEHLVRVEGKIKDPAMFGKLIVARRGNTPVYLNQVADIVDGEEERTSISRLNGKPVISLDIMPIQGANVVELGDGIKKSVSDLQKRLPDDVELKITEANSDSIKSSVDSTKMTIIEGGVLTVFIVFMFLHSWRSTVITALTLPISVLAAFIVVHAFGFTLNFLTLMALSLSIGLLIDDAIVVRENIVRHLAMGKSHFQAALEGTQEIGLAVMATTFAIVVVFVPVAFMHGIIGRFFYQFGITVTVAVLVSLFVSFTLDPMLSSIWHDPEEGRFKYMPWLGRLLGKFEQFIERVHGWYDAILKWSLDHRKSVLAIATATFLGSVALMPMLGAEFVPESDDGFIALQLNTPVGSSLDYTDAKVRQVEDILHGFKEIALVQTNVGTEDGRNYAFIGLKLVDKHVQPRRSAQEIKTDVRKAIQKVAGIELQLGNNGNAIFVSIIGPDASQLTAISQDLMQKIAKIPGIVDLQSSEKEAAPAVSVRINHEAASDLGVSNGQLGRVLRPLLAGDAISHWLASDGQNYDVIARLPRSERKAAADLQDLTVTSAKVDENGKPILVSMRQVADFVEASSPNQLKRLDLQRRVSVYANVDGRPSGTVGAEVRKILDKTALPPGYRFDNGGQQSDMAEAFTAFLGALGLAILFIYFILASQFASFVQPLAIMASLPLSLIGVVLALLVTGTTFNLFSMIGFIMLMGLVVKNGILLVDFANKGRSEGKPLHEALLEAGQVRLRPILMTTAAMVLGMLPMAIGAGDGGEIEAPMGRAIIGGVITSTMLTLVVVPVLYSYLVGYVDKRRARKAAKHAQSTHEHDTINTQVLATDSQA
ncbi:efflux RND transporter permease subunit [Burkholderiaceae bacterium DAT-1]|nr:efflux RND transporter permease subunit [Burkholderiaceae bacterium DAT-1]